jgi:hypothetical protein
MSVRADFATLLDLVLPWLPGCTDELALIYIRQAAREFCDQSWCWLRVSEPTPTIANDPELDLDIGADEQFVRLLSASMEGRDLCVGRDMRITDAMLSSIGTPTHVWSATRINLTLWPVPAASGALVTSQICVQPSDTAQGMPKELLALYGETIAAGALSKLLTMPKKPWTDTALGLERRAYFQDHADTIKSRVQRQFSSNLRRSTAHYF